MPITLEGGESQKAQALLEETLAKRGSYTAQPVSYGTQYAGAGYKLVFYSGKKGAKIVLQKAEMALQEELSLLFAPAAPKDSSKTDLPLPLFTEWFGTDESGKGDLFGPLVAAGVYANPQTAPVLTALGVKDSKTLTDAIVCKLAPQIRAAVGDKGYSVVVIGNEKYNELYEKIGNLNALLAWAHARVLQNLHAAHPAVKSALADKFGSAFYLERALGGTPLRLVQQPRAERDVAVAAASILAREAFLQKLAALSQQTGISLQKGCSASVARQAKILYNQVGVGMKQIAKLHFKTFQEIIAPAKGENQ